MKNVNKAIAFISALALMGTVTACGSTDSGTSSTSAETSATTETTPAKEQRLRKWTREMMKSLKTVL